MSKNAKIILNEWEGYPFFREKDLDGNIVECGIGRLIQNIRKFDSGVNFQIYLIVNTMWGRKKYILHKLGLSRSDEAHLKKWNDFLQIKEENSFIEELIYRNNIGQDLGAYNCGYQILKKSGYQGDVVFMNSSLNGPLSDGWLKKYQDQFYSHPKMGLTGISINSHNSNLNPNKFDPHVQSFFLYTNMDVLKNIFPRRLPGINITYQKKDIIDQGEIGISRKVLNEGYGLSCRFFDDYVYFKGDPFSKPEGDLRYKGPFAHQANKL